MINSIKILSENQKLNLILCEIISRIISISSHPFLDDAAQISIEIEGSRSILFILLTSIQKQTGQTFDLAGELKNNPNFVEINIHGKTLFNIVSEIIANFVKILSPKMENPFLEGESKKFFKVNDNLALVKLKPTLYSFTHNRYGIAEGTDELRMKFWALFSGKVNDLYINYSYLGGENIKSDNFDILTLASDYKSCTTEPFPSNYLGNVEIEKKTYSMVYFKPFIPPIEVVWKNYLVGTMKHNLKDVNNFKTRQGEIIEYEGLLPQEIIRFDWRNKLPNKDEAIPDDFADFYTDVCRAKITAKFVTRVLQSILSIAGYELLDLCYFITYNGDLICSEITPDGMRIKKKGDSFDKDLWRQGKDSQIISEVWNSLYNDLVDSGFTF